MITSNARIAASATLVALMALMHPCGVRAQIADIASTPIPTAAPISVKPNLMYILDDSGSMGWDHMPDHLDSANNCRTRTSTHGTNCDKRPPFYAPRVNGVYYNPQITYAPPPESTGVRRPNASVPTAANDGFGVSSGTTNIATNYPEVRWCAGTNDCMRNGIDTAGGATFNYHSDGFPRSASGKNYENASTINGAPYYFDIVPREYCTNDSLTTCALQTVPSGAFLVPAYVRYCNTSANAALNTAATTPAGSTPICQARYIEGQYTRMRLGLLKRVDIVPGTASYLDRPGREDCAARPTCSYAEEFQNFANWYSYYRTRLNTMKSATGHAFATIDDRFRIGLVTINAYDGLPGRYVPIGDFTPAKKAQWFDKLYSISPDSGTPLREALSLVGRHYAGVKTGINSFMPEDPVQNACQRNYALLTTDGYWNGSRSYDIPGNSVGNQDNVDSGLSARNTGSYDGGPSGSSDTVADVAMYYYKTDLRPSMGNNVQASGKDTATHQHMVTFTLGLGVDGFLKYDKDYETNPNSDFNKIRTGATGCLWSGAGTCNWPQASGSAKVDDLWHAAVNGRGTYFSASDPWTLKRVLIDALNAINNEVKVGAASAAATSTPNLTASDRLLFSSTHRTMAWTGELTAHDIDVTSGNITGAAKWSAAALLNGRTTANADSRAIYTFDGSTTNKLRDFTYNALTAGEKAWFDNVCASPAKLPQCATFTANQTTQANNGRNLVDYLRGQRGPEIAPKPEDRDNNDIYRQREAVLGDLVNSRPAYVAKPPLAYADNVTPPYTDFIAANATRRGVVYIGGNDGMLHAFAGDTGEELWAYVPRMVMPDLYRLASDEYSITHRFFVDGSPSVMDARVAGAWRTVLVGGMNAGGRGYYAMDVTDPTSPRALWEICADAARCAITDTDIGLTFGNPVITKRASDGRWVVLLTSGYNNVSPGTGVGILFVVDLATGAVLNKISTGVGSTTSPSGLARIVAFAENARIDNTAKYVYGGDLLGNVWKFDLTLASPIAKRIGELKDSAGKVQPVTTTPEVTRRTDGTIIVYVGTGRLLGPSDRQDPATLTPAATWSNEASLYAFKDRDTNLGNLRSGAANLVAQTLSVTSPTLRGVSTNAVDWSTRNGWYVDFNPGGTSPGERVNVDPQLVKGTLVVATNIPTGTECGEQGGSGWLYQFDYASGQAVPDGSGGTPSVGKKEGLVAMIVGVTAFRLPDGRLMGRVQLGDSSSTSTPISTTGTGTTGRRISWREVVR